MPELLLIDDDPGIQAALSTRLSAQGFAVRQAFSGQAGLDEIQRKRPDAVLLDVRMPGMDGFEVCRRVRAQRVLPLLPIIFLSAENREDAERAALDAGGSAFFSKPYAPAELIDTINRLIPAPSDHAEPA